jgi:hypothetical protein
MKAKITLITGGPLEGAYMVDTSDNEYIRAVVVHTAQHAFDYCEANDLSPVEVDINHERS